ncbi:hypothetical protein NKG99_20480 [Mesorhizobium sp. M1409]|uniref:hypothetical protein n=1 Tax=Mesorhizobium sp. M1409 TaxID=2957100 RepID=UPI0033376FD4
MSDLAKVESLLRQRRQEVAELEVALRVLQQLHGVQAQERPLVTIRRTMPLQLDGPRTKTSKRTGNKGKSIKLDPERAQRDRDAIIEALRKTTAPLTSREVIFAVLGERPEKKRRDHVYWALKNLRDNGNIILKDKLYLPLPREAA